MRKRTLLILGLAAALGLAGAVGWPFFGYRIHERWRRRGFDAAAWKDVETLTNDARLRMVDDLLRRYNFRGMARARVTALLGEPRPTGYFKGWDLVYWLGPERGWISIDSEWLVFRLDADKKVSDYKIVRD